MSKSPHRRFVLSTSVLLGVALCSGLQAPKAQAAALTWSPDGSGDWNTAGAWGGGTWNSGTPDSATFNGTAGGTITGNATTSGVTVNGTANYTFSGVLSGAGVITKNGTSTLTLSGANNYSGGTVISQGTLISGVATTTLGTGAITLGDGATGNNNVKLQFNANITAGQIGSITVANTGSSGTATIAVNTNANVTSSNLILSRATVFTGTGGTPNNQVLVGNISGSGAGAGNDTVIVNSGAGNALTMYAKAATTNTYTGNLRVQSGTLQIGSSTYNGNTAPNQNLAIPDAASVTVDAGAVLTFVWTGAETFDALNGAGTLNRNVGDGQGNVTLTIGAGNGSGTFSGAITSQFNLVKTGTGVQILSGANTYGGTTTVNGGLLNVAGSLTSAVTVASGATLSGRGGTTNSTLTLSAGSSIVGVAQVAGAGNAFRSGAASAVTAGASVAILGSDGSGTVGVHNLDVVGYGITPGTANFSTANYRTPGAVTDDLVNKKITFSYTNAARTWNSAAGTWDNLSTAAWQEGDFQFAAGDAVTFDDTGTGGGGARTVTLNQVITPGDIVFNNTTSTYTLGGTGSIAGATAITKNGTGTVILATAGAYTGATTVSAGVLNIQNNNALGSTAGGTSVTAGAALQIQGGITVGTEALTLNGTGISNDGALRNISGANAMSGAITLGSAVRINSDAGTLTLSGNVGGAGQNLTVGGAGNMVIAGAIGTGTGSLTKDGTGTVTLTGTNTYTGGTTVTAGTLRLDLTARATNSPLNMGTLTVNPAGTLELFVNNAPSYAATALFSAGSTFTGTGTITKTGTGVADFWNNTNISGFAGLIDIQAGGLSNQTTTSPWSASAGNMDMNIASGAFFDLRTDNAVINKLTGSGVIGNSFSQAHTLTIGAQGGSSTFDGVIQNSLAALAAGTTAGGTIAITKTGAGTQTLSGANTYTGLTTVSNGILNIQNNTALGSTAGSTTVTSGGTLELNGGLTIGAETLNLTGTGTGGIGALHNIGTNTYGGQINVLGAGVGATINNGGGTLTLTGGVVKNGTTATFTGAGGKTIISGTGISGAAAASDLVVDGTTLVVNAASNYNGPTDVINGGTLAGIGPITSTVVTIHNDGSRITAGTDELSGTKGILRFTATTVKLDGTYLADINLTNATGYAADGTAGDLISIVGDVDLTNTVITLRGTNAPPAAGSHYAIKLLEWTGTATGATADFSGTVDGLGLQAGQSIVRWGNAYYLVPEPASFALLALGSLLLLRRPTRRRARQVVQA